MITAWELGKIKSKFGLGQIIKVYNPEGMDKKRMEYVRIVGLYPNFVLVSNGLYKWSVNYQDLLDKIS